jgi:hypothetical protein
MAAAAGAGGGGGGGFEVRDRVAAFPTYEDYLDSQIAEVDMFYLENEEVARQLIELGYRGSGDTLKRDEFDARKRADREKHLHRDVAPKPLASMGKALGDKPLLAALAAREELVRNGKLSVIVYIRDVNGRGQEVSGYLDYGARLKAENWEPVFDGKKKLLPRPSDLSYYNWDTQASTSNASPNFAVIADGEAGLLFKNKRDRKVINVDPRANPGDNTTRTEVRTTEALQVVIYDHFSRKRA